MQNNTESISPYIALEFCSCQQDFTKKPISHRDLGDIGTLTNYSMVVAGAASSELLSKYMENQGVSKSINTFYKYKIVGNFGIFSYLFKKVEGKDNERAIKEAVFESAAGIAITSKTTKTLATRAASRFGIAMAGRILGSAVGSVIPIGGTILGAIAGAWLAGKVEEWWFSDGDKALESTKAENQNIAKLEEAYLLKINHINDYLISNQYIELRVLNENESENLCKEISNLQSDYFNTIELMLSYKNYLKQQSNLTQESSQSLSSSPSSFSYSFFPPDRINAQRIGTISFDIKALDEITRMPIAHTKIQLENANLGQQSLTDSQGLASFTLLKRRDNDKTRFS